MKKFQQQGNMTRGNPLVEQLVGNMMRGLMPKMPASPKQLSAGGYGSMAKMAMGHGGVKGRFSGKTNLKKFLMQYSRYGKKSNKALDLKKLMKW